MARLAIPLRHVSAIFVKQTISGDIKYIREPYNVVALDFGDGSAVQTYVEPISGGARSILERTETYDEVRFYDSPPFPGTRIGYGSAGQ